MDTRLSLHSGCWRRNHSAAATPWTKQRRAPPWSGSRRCCSACPACTPRRCGWNPSSTTPAMQVQYVRSQGALYNAFQLHRCSIQGFPPGQERLLCLPLHDEARPCMFGGANRPSRFPTSVLYMCRMLSLLNSVSDSHLTTLQCCRAEWLSRKVDRISLCVLIVAYVAILIAVLVS